MPDPIAIVGIGCRFPGASGPDAFWRLLLDGGDAVSEVPPERWDVEALFDPDPGAPGRISTRWAALVDDIDAFDAEFFGISPREARRVDPQQRLLLEVAWEALEDAGIPPTGLAGSATGVFVGISSHDYGDQLLAPGRRDLIDAYAPAGGAGCIAANRLSHHLDLRGPSVAVDTACSSSLTALHLACLSLAAEECELAVVGGVNVLLAPEVTMGFCRAGMLSPRGRCRPFDAGADGYVRGEGAGAVVLLTLERARREGAAVRAVIRATAANQDGRTPGLSQPSPTAQEDLLRRALEVAGVPPRRVGYVEAHGTGTPAGDPVEAAAIGRAIGAARPEPSECLIGSVKGNIGHLEAAAGIAGLTKAALALERRRIPGTLHHERPSPAIDWDGLRLRVVTATSDWPGGDHPPVAVVSSFGFGGANAAAVLEAAPSAGAVPGLADDGIPRVLPLSARSPEALRALAAATAECLAGEGAPSLRDACHTAALRRSHHRHRLALAAASATEAGAALRAWARGESAPQVAAADAGAGPPRLAFAFTGMGPQWWGMGRELLSDEPVAAAALAECDRLLRPLAGWSLVDELGADEGESRVAGAEVAHAANLALQVALVELWRSWGVAPDVVVGHSSGEAGAAWAAGALDLADALRLAFHRGRLQARLAGAGGMLAVDLAPEAAAAAIDGHDGRVALAAVNAPASVTLSGETAALDRISRALRREGVRCVPLPVDVPYHGPQMEAVREELAAALAGLRPRPPATAMVSTVTGLPVDGRPLDAGYWWENVRRPVRFADAVARLAADGVDCVVEVGPHPVLAPPLAQSLAGAGRSAAVLPSLRRGEPERRAMLRSLAELHARGRPVDWEAVNGPRGRLVALPRYPWRRERHWLEPDPGGVRADAAGAHPALGRRVRAARPTWELPLDAPQLAFLHDHAVRGAPAFPAAGYLELALAAARTGRPEGALALERVELRRLLQLTGEPGRVLQCALDEETGLVELHGSSGAGAEPAWILHARARLAPPPGDAAPPVDVAAIRRRCPVEVDPAALYRRLADDRGLAYGPAFRGVASLRRGRDQAIGEVVAPEGLVTRGREAHPALMDAALHVAAAALEGLGSAVPEGTVVPVAVDRAELMAALPRRLWVHASVEPGAGGDLLATVALVDEGGERLARLEGVRLRALDRGAAAARRAIRYREEWVPVPQGASSAPGRPPPADRLAAAGRAALRRAVRAHRLADYYAIAEPALDAEARAGARRALAELGWEPGAEARVLGVSPGHAALMERVVAMAGAPGGEGRAAALAAARPEYASFAGLVRASGQRLADTLRGREDAREWLFAEPAFGMLVDAYALAPPFRAAAETLAGIVAAARPGTRAGLRVIEVGAGTGGTTRAVLDLAGGAVRELLVTDVSPLLVRRARELLGDDPRLRFGELDLEGDPPPGEGGFDVAIAANVVHATRDLRESLRALRRLLAPGGLLLLQEGLRPAQWTDLVFGQLAGWWRFADRDLRPDHPLASRAAWSRALADAGFEGSAVVADAPPEGEPSQAVLVARARAGRRAASTARARRAGRRWLLLADEGGVADAVAGGLIARGERPALVVRPGPAARATAPGRAEVRPERPADWAWALRRAAADGPLHGVVHLWGPDAPAPGDLSADRLLCAQDRLCAGTAALVRGLRAAGRPPRALWIVTAGAQFLPGDPAPPAVAQATLWGLGRVLRHEHGGIDCRLVDLPAEHTPDDLAALLDELVAPSGEGEEELVVRGGRAAGRRVTAAPAVAAEEEHPAAASPARTAFRLAVGSAGRLETLALSEVEARAPGPGEVAIRVEAAALNFKDVLLALGMLAWPGTGEPVLGMECAGVVAARGPGVAAPREGDRVIAIAFGTLGSRIVTRAELTAPAPGGLTHEEAATIPGAFASALEGLRHLARVRRDERVLVHSAAGGVGLAAVQVAHLAGAEVLATVSTEEKRAYLRSLGVRHVMDSRSLAFADEVRAITGGEGVDVVLNSLAGPAMSEGLGLLRPGGRFVEMGRRDIDRDAPVRLGPFVRGLSFLSMRLARIVQDRPEHIGALLREAVDGLERGALEPLPHTVFDLADAEQGFRLMAGGRHIGRIVVSVGDTPRPVRRRPRALVRGDATYLLLGGLGGLGLDLAGHMARRGARHLVLASRSGAPRPEEAPALAALRASGAEVVTARCDAARPADLARLLARVRASMPPLRGVVHAAMVLDDAPLERLDRARVRAAMAPKAAGAWNLHELTLGDDLDLFLLLGSVASVVGPPGQAAYAAANTFLVALAEHRRALGLPALAVDLGAVSGAGHVAGRPAVEDLLGRIGIRTVPPGTAWAEVDEALRRGDARLTLADIDWEAWSRGPAAGLSGAALVPPAANGAAQPAGSAAGDPGDQVAAIVGRVLESPAGRLDRRRPLTELGLDSLMAVEVTTAIERELGVAVSLADVLEGLSIGALADIVAARDPVAR